MAQRLIDANKIKYRTVGAGGWNQPENVVSDYEIEKMPTVDAVQVVRCANCKYFELYGLEDSCGHPRLEHHGQATFCKADDFCSYGKNKI